MEQLKTMTYTDSALLQTEGLANTFWRSYLRLQCGYSCSKRLNDNMSVRHLEFVGAFWVNSTVFSHINPGIPNLDMTKYNK